MSEGFNQLPLFTKFDPLSSVLSPELVQSTLGETRKLVLAYLHGANLPLLPMTRRAQLSGGGRLQQMPSRNVAMRAAMRSDQRQMVATPYPTTSPHKQQR